MKLKRMKGSSGAKWKKGQSCISNPQNNKYRSAAQGNFFQKLEGESSLTVEALAKHTAALAVEPKLCADAEDDKSVGQSFNTFATNFTTCTVPAFQKFFKNFKLDSDLQTRMLAIHAAAQEYIQDAKLPETATSYMCALMSSLEAVKDSEEDVCATLSLVAKVIRKVSQDVLKLKFGEFSKLFDEIFTAFASSPNSKLLINVIGCLSHLLRAQDEIQWTYSYTNDVLHRMMSFAMHENIELRRSAQYNVSAVLRASSFIVSKETAEDDKMETVEAASSENPRFHPASKLVGEFILHNLKLASQEANGKATLLLLVFLQEVIVCFPEKTVEQCCGRVLSVMHIGDTVICSRSMKIFKALFSGSADNSVPFTLKEETLRALLNALTTSDASSPLKIVPGVNHVDLVLVWLETLAEGVVGYIKMNNTEGIAWFATWVKQLTGFWKSEHRSVHEKVWHTLDIIFDDGLKKLPQITPHVDQILRALKHLEERLSLQYKPAWPFVFKSLCPFFSLLGREPSASAYLVDLLKNLSLLMHTDEIDDVRDLEKAVGTAIESMGPEEIMKVIPIKITGDLTLDEASLWILPLLRKHVRNPKLKFFVSFFVPLTKDCNKIIEGLKSQGKSDSVLVKTYQQIEWQIWALLPTFTKRASDIDEALSNTDFARLLCDHIRSREDTRLNVLSTLRLMISSEEKSKCLVKYSDKYFKALVNVYLFSPRNKPHLKDTVTADAGQRIAAYTTIEQYMPLLTPSLRTQFFDLVMKSYENEKENLFRRKAFLSLIRIFISYLDQPNLLVVYEKAKAEIQQKKSLVQKISYRLLEDIISSESEVCSSLVKSKTKEILHVLNNTSKSVQKPALSSRLGCCRKILPFAEVDLKFSNVNDWKGFVDESIRHCAASDSVPTRTAAFSLLLAVGQSIRRVIQLSDGEILRSCYSLLPSLHQDVPANESELTANAIHALNVLFLQYKEVVPSDLLASAVRDVSSLFRGSRLVIKSGLKFIRSLFSKYPTPVMSDHVDVFMKGLLNLSQTERRKFRDEIRDILASLSRKFGVDRMRGLIPEKDVLRRVFINVVKSDNRNKRSLKAEQDSIDEDVEDQEPTSSNSLNRILEEIDREIETDERSKPKPSIGEGRKKKKQAWIKEDKEEVLDLLDFSSGQNITSKKPKEKKLRFADETPKTEEEKYGFKMDKNTNKFIITDMDDSDHENDFVGLDSKEDDEVDLKSILSPGKRKRTNSENSDEFTRTTNSRGKRTAKKMDYGNDFRSKKAHGDVQKKSGVLPYAYVQFSKDRLNRRKKAKFAGQFKSLVRGAKKGVAKGAKARKKKR